jgi:hypothetical protein
VDDDVDDRKTHYDEHGALIVPMSDQHVIDLYEKWIEQSLSSVISVLATKEYILYSFIFNRASFKMLMKHSLKF